MRIKTTIPADKVPYRPRTVIGKYDVIIRQIADTKPGYAAVVELPTLKVGYYIVKKLRTYYKSMKFSACYEKQEEGAIAYITRVS
jgi:hypothetical protein